MIIDFENHMYLADMVEKTDSHSGKICERYWDTDGKLKIKIFKNATNISRYIQFMDDAGIDKVVLTSHVKTFDQCKRWNDICAKLVKEHTQRIIGFASIPAVGGKPALDELERAIKELGLKGVHIYTTNDGRFLDSKDMWPFYEKVSQLDIPVDIHITEVPSGFDALNAPYALYYVMGRELDMCSAVLRVCLGGVLEDFPDLKLIMNHFGGGVSSMIERLDTYTSYVGHGWPGFYNGKPLISKPWRHYWDKLYFNMAGREIGLAAITCALTSISPKKLLFGTDWPFNFDYDPEGVKQYVKEIQKLNLSKIDIDGMLGGNGAKLLKMGD